MYPTWTKNETKEILRFKEKYGKDTHVRTSVVIMMM
jgi:hypothetical protein